MVGASQEPDGNLVRRSRRRPGRALRHPSGMEEPGQTDRAVQPILEGQGYRASHSQIRKVGERPEFKARRGPVGLRHDRAPRTI